MPCLNAERYLGCFGKEPCYHLLICFNDEQVPRRINLQDIFIIRTVREEGGSIDGDYRLYCKVDKENYVLLPSKVIGLED